MVPSRMLSLLYFLVFSFKSYNVCAVKPTVAMITVHFNDAKRWLDILKLLFISHPRTDKLDAVNKLNERQSAGEKILSVKHVQLLKKIGDKIFARAEDFNRGTSGGKLDSFRLDFVSVIFP